jgi:hypothetical protein
VRTPFERFYRFLMLKYLLHALVWSVGLFALFVFVKILLFFWLGLIEWVLSQ